MKQSCIRASDIRIPEQQQLVMASSTMYGLGFREVLSIQEIIWL
jgi:hypothetical protein